MSLCEGVFLKKTLIAAHLRQNCARRPCSVWRPGGHSYSAAGTGNAGMWGFSSNKLLEQREQERTKRLHEQRVRGAKSTIKQKGMNKLPMGVRQKRTEGRSPPHSPDPSRSRPTSAHPAAGRKGAGGGPANRKPKLNTQAEISGVYGSYHDGEGGADDCPSPHSMDGFARGGGGGQYSECFSDAGGGSADELSDEIEDDGQYGNDYYSGSEGEYSGSSDEKDDPGEESILAQSTLEVGLTGLGPNQARPPSGSRLSSANSAQERRAFISAVRGGSAASQASSAADSNVSADSGLESTNAEKRAFIASVRSASRPSSAATSIDTASPTSALAPPMGFNSWNFYHCNIDENTVKQVLDAISTNGMKEAGYEYVNIDDCWQVERFPNGTIQPDPARFPSGMKALADYAHKLGLKFGVYTARGSKTCQNRPGAYAHELVDAQTYCDWGLDYLKNDNCGGTNWPQENTSWIKFQSGFDKCFASTGRYVVKSIEYCRDPAGCADPEGAGCCGDWIADVANLWRTGGDVQNTWSSIMGNIHSQNDMADVARPGHFNGILQPHACLSVLCTPRVLSDTTCPRRSRYAPNWKRGLDTDRAVHAHDAVVYRRSAPARRDRPDPRIKRDTGYSSKPRSDRHRSRSRQGWCHSRQASHS